MSTYIETHYLRDEFAETDYPQKLCDHIVARFIAPHFGGAVEGRTMLDIGSGKGNHLVGFGRRGLTVTGLDKLPDRHEMLAQFEIRPCDLERDRFPFDDDAFDVVFSKSVIEHVWNTDNFLSEARRVLKPGGLLVLMCPDWRTQAHMYWDDYTHVKPWTRKGLQNALKIHAFRNVEAMLFRQLPALWRYPTLEYLADVIAFITPETWKWKDKEEKAFHEWIRFSKEKMLLATAVK